MTDIIIANFNAPDALTRTMAERMSRFDLQERLEFLTNSFDNITMRTQFSLADQVLLHGLVSIGANVDFVTIAVSNNANTQSLIKITQDAYDVSFENNMDSATQLLLDSNIRIAKKTSFAGRDAVSGVIAINPLADWSQAQLVQYVLDHEVPVNPEDMPGFVSRAA